MPQEGVAFCDAGGVTVALFGRAALDHNVGSEAEVDAVLAQAVVAGATLKKLWQEVFWGGYAGDFSDPAGQNCRADYCRGIRAPGRWGGHAQEESLPARDWSSRRKKLSAPV
jgi:hypothetical protein